MDEVDATAEPAEAEPAQAAEGAGGPSAQADTFFDPSQLPPELQDHWKRMQGAYTKKMQKLAGAREAASIVERFNSDPDFARQTIMQRAQQLGLNIGQPGQQPQTPMQQGQDVPAQLVEAVKAKLSPELQWMAPSLAASQWAGMQMAMQPLKEQQAAMRQNADEQQWEQLTEQLSQKAPGWEEHEDDMNALLDFLQSKKMTDRRWGSKLELLHSMVIGPGQANATAARRMAEAARHRQPAGMPMGQPVVNMTDQIVKAKTNQDAWDAAAKQAVAQLARQGIKVP